MDEFKVMNSPIMISQYNEKEGQIDPYMRKFVVIQTLILKLFTHSVAYVLDFFEDKMSFIPMAERKNRLVRKKEK